MYNASTHGRPLVGWHIDGTDKPTLDNKSTSTIIMVYVSGPTPEIGGKTVMLTKSHRSVAKYILDGGKNGRSYVTCSV